MASFAINITFLLFLSGILQGSSVPSLLLATESGLHIYHGENASVVTIHDNQPGCPAPCIASVAYRAHSQEIYFISNGHIWLSYYSHVTKNYVDPIVVLEDSSSISDLLVDWVDYKLYFVNNSQSILRTDLLKSNISTVALADTHLRHLNIDPYERLLFYTENDTLKLMDLKNGQSFDQLQISAWGEISKLTLDLPRHFLYLISVTRTPEGDSWSLVRAGYTRNSTEEHRVVYRGAQLKRATALAVIEDTVVWTSVSHTDEPVLYMCKVYLCSSKYIQQIPLPFQNIVDMKMYSVEGQKAGTEYACLQLHCPDKCLQVSPYVVQCICPPGKTFDSFSNLCVEESRASWGEVLHSSTRGLRHTLGVWMDGLAARLATLILCCCLLMLLTLEVGLCLLPCAQQQSRHQPAETRRQPSLETITEI